MRDFVTCLEFLTRIRFSKRTSWSEDDFSRSVPYFPIVGLVIGVLLAIVNQAILGLHLEPLMRVTVLILAEIMITGALMYDGFMDTADGIFSARDRDRMLEIMKDSNVGSNAVLAVIVLVLLKISAYLQLPPEELSLVLIAMSVTTRTFMVLYIVNFPYARKEGIGSLFKKFARPVYTYIAFAIGAAIVLASGTTLLLTSAVCFFPLMGAAWYLVKLLGGLTGDTYGALTETGNILFLLIFILITG